MQTSVRKKDFNVKRKKLIKLHQFLIHELAKIIQL